NRNVTRSSRARADNSRAFSRNSSTRSANGSFMRLSLDARCSARASLYASSVASHSANKDPSNSTSTRRSARFTLKAITILQNYLARVCRVKPLARRHPATDDAPGELGFKGQRRHQPSDAHQQSQTVSESYESRYSPPVAHHAEHPPEPATQTPSDQPQ